MEKIEDIKDILSWMSSLKEGPKEPEVHWLMHLMDILAGMSLLALALALFL